MAAFRYWRLYITARDGDPDYTSIGEVELLNGTTDLTEGLGGSATASNSGIGLPAFAVDGNVGNPWGTPDPVPVWWAIDLGSVQNLTSYTVRSQESVTGRTPTAWELQGNDESALIGAPWAVVDTRSGETGWGVVEVREYAIDAVPLVPSTLPTLRIGRRLGDTPLPLTATLDEIRMSVGSGRNFVSQVAPWPNPGEPDPDSSDNGWVDITASKAGFTPITKRFTVTRARAGVDGVDGAGSVGPAGPRGTVNVSRAIVGTVWSDVEAALAISVPGYGVPQSRDIVTLYNTAAGFSETRFYDGSAWLVLTEYINGNLLVSGTIAGEKLAVDSITTNKIQVGAASDPVGADLVATTYYPDPGTGLLTSGTQEIVDLTRGAPNSYCTTSFDGSILIKLNNYFGGLPVGHYVLSVTMVVFLVDMLTSVDQPVGSHRVKYRQYMDSDDVIELPFCVVGSTNRAAIPSLNRLRYQLFVNIAQPVLSGGAVVTTILEYATITGIGEIIEMKL